MLMGRVETKSRPSAQFAAMPNVSSARHEILGAATKSRGWLPRRDVVVFSDSNPSLADTGLRARMRVRPQRSLAEESPQLCAISFSEYRGGAGHGASAITWKKDPVTLPRREPAGVGAPP